MVIETFNKQAPISKLLRWSNINPSRYYYSPRNGKRGRLPSDTTLKTDGSVATNHDVVEVIRDILNIEFLCYGYVPITDELADRGFLIIHKKVYRLMKESKLLCGSSITLHGG